MRRFLATAALLTAAALPLAGGGCESDTVAPHDTMPALDQAGVARQTGLVGAGMNVMIDEMLGYDAAKNTYTRPIVGDYFAGEVVLDYRCGGETGQPCAEDGAQTDWVGASGYVEADLADLPDLELRVDLALAADPFDPVEECGTVDGGGTVTAGLYHGTFTVVGVGACAGSYPESGRLTVVGVPSASAKSVDVPPPPMASIFFDGTRTPPMTVGEGHYLVDLETGAVLPVTPLKGR